MSSCFYQLAKQVEKLRSQFEAGGLSLARLDGTALPLRQLAEKQLLNDAAVTVLQSLSEVDRAESMRDLVNVLIRSAWLVPSHSSLVLLAPLHLFSALLRLSSPLWLNASFIMVETLCALQGIC